MKGCGLILIQAGATVSVLTREGVETRGSENTKQRHCSATSVVHRGSSTTSEGISCGRADMNTHLCFGE